MKLDGRARNLIEKFDKANLAMTSQIDQAELRELRSGPVKMLVYETNDHWEYLSKFLIPRFEPIYPGVLGIAKLSVPMNVDGRQFRIVTYWAITHVRKSVEGDRWIIRLGAEVGEDNIG